MTILTIMPREVQAVIASGVPFDLIDVRTGMEFTTVHAVGAQHVPLSGLDPAAVMAGRRAPKDDPLYIICASGARSASAARAFVDAGITNVFSVAGGIGAWASAGLPVERNATMGMVRQVAIYAVVFAAAMALMPCSPFSIWGSAACPVVPAVAAPISPSNASGVVPGATAFDFTRDVVEASKTKPVLVDFFATWCGPCKMLAPELDAVVQARGVGLALVRVDVDQHSDVAKSQSIESVPEVRLWKDGQEVARFVGFRTRDAIGTWIDAAIAGKAP